jgi:peptide-methionine (S)-S-oxide reductase
MVVDRRPPGKRAPKKQEEASSLAAAQELKEEDIMHVLMGAFVFLMLLSNHSEGNQMDRLEKATFGAGCFWCVEAVFEQLDGVTSVVVGYAGGHTAHPTYEQVCTGKTGHAEATQITFDPNKISYKHLLEIFWDSHDPTTLNRQGADVGTQYRSVIFYHNEEQRKEAEQSRTEAQKNFKETIVTEIKPLTEFYPAENYHQDYFRNNPNAPYCRLVIAPKLHKLKLK